MIDWSWPNFSFDEMACKGSGECEMNPEFMDRLQALRDALGAPLPVTSGYRSREYNARVSSKTTEITRVRFADGVEADMPIAVLVEFTRRDGRLHRPPLGEPR